MCLVALALGESSRFPLVIAANRDEFFDRPAAPLATWSAGEVEVIGGRDLRAGGTWFGLTRRGRIALVTNVREPAVPVPADAPSRGDLVLEWLTRDAPFDDTWQALAPSRYAGFNLVALEGADGTYASNRPADHARPLSRGVHGLSNAGLDDPWPKVVALKARLTDALAQAGGAEALATALFSALADDRTAPDIELPHTGVPLEVERVLSAAFIRFPARGYGTRSSMVVVRERRDDREITLAIERTFAPSGAVSGERRVAI